MSTLLMHTTRWMLRFLSQSSTEGRRGRWDARVAHLHHHVHRRQHLHQLLLRLGDVPWVPRDLRLALAPAELLGDREHRLVLVHPALRQLVALVLLGHAHHREAPCPPRAAPAGAPPRQQRRPQRGAQRRPCACRSAEAQPGARGAAARKGGSAHGDEARRCGQRTRERAGDGDGQPRAGRARAHAPRPPGHAALALARSGLPPSGARACHWPSSRPARLLRLPALRLLELAGAAPVFHGSCLF